MALTGCAQQVEVKNQGEPATSSSVETADVTPADKRVSLEITDSGYSFDDYSGDFGFIIKNANQGWAAENVQVIVTGKDDSGAIVGTYDEYITLLLANGSNGYAGEFPFEGATTLEFQVVDNPNMWTQETLQQAELDEALFAQNINEIWDSYGYLTIAGEVVNNMEQAFSGTQVSAIYYDADGKIVGGDMTYLNNLPAETTLPFSIYGGKATEHASVKVFVDCGYPSN